MKITTLIAGASLLFAVHATAAFKSAQLLPDNSMPGFPPALIMDGITRGRVVVAVSVDATGGVVDSLVLGYTDARLARSSVEAVRGWRFAPAQLDGAPVPVQTELTFDYTVKGAVITANLMTHFLYDCFDDGSRPFVYRPGDVRRLDGPPVKIGGEKPKYATAARDDGVRGRVEVRFYIDEQGAVRLPAIATPVHPYLAEQAVAAVRTWKFQPVTDHGRPVLVQAEQAFDFGGDR